MNVSLDVSDFTAMLSRVEREIDKAPENIHRIAKTGAEELRRNDPYQNRTGDLRASTQALRIAGGSSIVMEMPYASFVKNLGYSYFDSVTEQTKGFITYGLQTALNRASG